MIKRSGFKKEMNLDKGITHKTIDSSVNDGGPSPTVGPPCKDGHGEMKKKKKSGGKKGTKYGLVSFEELPEYMKDNEFILNYYRAEWPLKQAFLSVFRWHNETLNVWTHLIGFVLFLGLTIANLVPLPPLADFMPLFMWNFPTSSHGNLSQNSQDFFQGPNRLADLNIKMDIAATTGELARTVWPFYVFLGGSMFCLLSSSTCHLFSCHSHHLTLQLLQMDYAGIAVMIITSFFPPIYYIFQCTPHWQIVYLSGITVMGVCTIITLLTPAFSTGKYRSFRAGLFLAMGLSGLIPAVHALMVNWDEPERNVTLAYEAAMGLFYVIGTLFYMTRVPERWMPGFFDLAGHSHQIFHVFVIFGAMSHYAAAQIFLEYRSRLSCM